MSDSSSSYTKLLTQWGLAQYIVLFDDEGYDYVPDWINMKYEELVKDLGMKKGHAKRFIRNAQKLKQQPIVNQSSSITEVKYDSEEGSNNNINNANKNMIDISNSEPFEWSAEQVQHWLHSYTNGKLVTLVPVFKENMIAGNGMCKLTNSDLKNELGVARFGLRMSFIHLRDELLIANSDKAQWAKKLQIDDNLDVYREDKKYWYSCTVIDISLARGQIRVLFNVKDGEPIDNEWININSRRLAMLNTHKKENIEYKNDLLVYNVKKKFTEKEINKFNAEFKEHNMQYGWAKNDVYLLMKREVMYSAQSKDEITGKLIHFIEKTVMSSAKDENVSAMPLGVYNSFINYLSEIMRESLVQLSSQLKSYEDRFPAQKMCHDGEYKWELLCFLDIRTCADSRSNRDEYHFRMMIQSIIYRSKDNMASIAIVEGNESAVVDQKPKEEVPAKVDAPADNANNVNDDQPQSNLLLDISPS